MQRPALAVVQSSSRTWLVVGYTPGRSERGADTPPFAPADANLVERLFTPRPPTALYLHLWREVANHALRYWSRLREEAGLSTGFRGMLTGCRATLARLIDEHS